MANYLVHHTKKKQILQRKEEALQRLIESGATDDELLAAAAEVREARLRVLQVQRSAIIPKGDCEGKYAKIDQKIKQAASLTPAEILADFHSCSNHSCSNHSCSNHSCSKSQI